MLFCCVFFRTFFIYISFHVNIFNIYVLFLHIY
uniref:Uncharacterized protein n=1 Tax=Podoviridae sp. ctxqo3 TaxID=2827755 RepID=A0A8S5SZC0_9CAUD|nr:MAG TPA: hypothetical protein [Podoviridae sp. ctxqo3]